MKGPGLLTRVDDLLNPIVVKELRQAVKSRLVVFALLLFLTLQTVILFLFIMYRPSQSARATAELDFHAGREVFVYLHAILLGTCMLLVPLYAGARLGFERSDVNVDLLFISTLKPRSIIAGKFFAAVVLILLIFSACAPFLTFTYLLRGLDVPTILVALALDFLSVLLCTQVSIFLGTVPGHWVFKVLLGLAGFGFLMVVLGMELTGWSEFLRQGEYIPLESWDFWLPALAVLAGILGIMGLLFVWSVALVSPASANRALPVRLYTAAQWVVTAIAAAAWSRHIGFIGPIFAWLILQTILFNIQMLISVNEREQWSSRVARSIPRWRPLRLPAFLTYSGAAGGLTFSVLFLGLTQLAYYLWGVWSSTLGPDPRVVTPVIEATLVASLYMLCYCVLTVLIRSYFLVGRIKPSHTWVLWLTLVAVGSAVPYIVDYFVFFNEHYRSRAPEIDWWLLPNPFAAVLDVLYESRYSSVVFESRGLLFSSVWAVLMIIAAIPWYAKQVLHFHPPLVTPTSGGRKSLDQQRPHQSAHTARPSTEISR